MGCDLVTIAATGGAFPALINPQVDGITIDVLVEQYPSPVKIGDEIRMRGRSYLVAVVREWLDGGTQLAVSLINKTGVLYRREATTGAYGHAYTIIEKVPFSGVFRIMSTNEHPESVRTIANLMPVGGWDWPGHLHDIIRLEDGTEWEQHGDTMSDRTALSMVLSGTAVVQLKKIPPTLRPEDL